MPSFNIRIYGLWVSENNQVLVSRELIAGQQFLKFPGGGLEWGEGTLDALVSTIPSDHCSNRSCLIITAADNTSIGFP